MSKRLKISLIFAILAATITAAYIVVGPDRSTDSFPVPDPNDPRLVSLGTQVYDKSCAACHGDQLEGEPNWRTALPEGGLPAPPHDETGHTWHHPDDLLLKITKYGGQSVAPAGFISRMPAFGHVLSDEEIAAVLAYIKSQWPEEIQNRQRQITAKSQQ